MQGLDTYAAFGPTYGSVEDAEADHEAIKSLNDDDGVIDTFDAAAITKTDKDKVKIVKKHEQPLRQGAWVVAASDERQACAWHCSPLAPSSSPPAPAPSRRRRGRDRP